MVAAHGLAVSELAALFAIPGLPDRMRGVEKRLQQVLSPFDAVLTPAGRGNVHARGKRLRPVLALVSAEVGGVFDKRVIDAAVAVELIQIGSLIHDDLVEGATTRRGAPTVNAADGEGLAVITGDLVFAKAAVIAAGLGADPAEMLADGLVDMATGQMRELQQLFDQTRTAEQVAEVAHGKTGALFACACRLGAWCADLPPKQRESLTRYGWSFGVGFQILDDLLDVIGNPEAMGKPVGADIAAGVYNLPTVLALQQRGSQTLRRLLKRGDKDALDEARARIAKSKAIDQCFAAVDHWMTEAERAARKLPQSATSAGLQAFPKHYVRWALSQFT